MRQQQQQQHQQHNHNHLHNHNHGTNPSYIPPELSAAVSQLLSNPEAKEKLQTLGLKIEAQKSIIKSDVETWDEVKRKQYFDHSLDIPLLDSFTSIGDNPIGRMERLMNMNDEEMNALITLQTVLEFDRMNGGSLTDQFSRLNITSSNIESNNNGNGSNNRTGSANTVWGLMSALGSSSGASSAPMQHSHTHTHNHAHGQGCSAHNIEPTVSTGKSDKMER